MSALRKTLNLIIVVCLLTPVWPNAALAAGDTTPPLVEIPAEPDSEKSVEPPNLSKYGQLPISFIPNRGQIDGTSAFYAQAGQQTIHFMPNGVTTEFTLTTGTKRKQPPGPHRREIGAMPEIKPADVTRVTVPLEFVGASESPQITAGDKRVGVVNYFIGNDPAQWQSNIPTYGQLSYHNLWPGVDATYQGKPGALKSTFTVSPGADPTQIKLTYPTADVLSVDKQGNLVIQSDGITLTETAPIAWQDTPHRQAVPVRYRLLNDKTYTFEFPQGYNPAYPLIIDPELVYSTFYGGPQSVTGMDIAVDETGNAYVAVGFNSSDYSYNDMLVIKLNPTGTDVLYSTIIGGSGDYGGVFAIATDNTGSVYLTGCTDSSDFPVTVDAIDDTLDGDEKDAFVVKLDTLGNIDYATFLGGNSYDCGRDIAVDSSGNIYVGGYTDSSDFPTTAGALKETLSGGGDAFLVKLNPTGTALIFSTYIGGNDPDEIKYLKVDEPGNVYAAGETSSPDFPVTVGAFDTTCGSDGICDYGADIFVLKLNKLGSEIDYATFLGGEGWDSVGALALGKTGDAYLTGETPSLGFPVTSGAFDTIEIISIRSDKNEKRGKI